MCGRMGSPWELDAFVEHALMPLGFSWLSVSFIMTEATG